MAESFDAGQSSKAGQAVPSVPPSTSEISVRTMASDIDLMGKSGGMLTKNLPQIEHVPISAASITPPPVGPTGVAAPQIQKTPQGSLEPIIWTGIAILLAGILFAVGFYIYPLLSSSGLTRGSS